MARPPFTFARNTLGSNGSFAQEISAIRRGLYRQVTRLFAFENPANTTRSLARFHSRKDAGVELALPWSSAAKRNLE
jgi:hypothetical protein